MTSLLRQPWEELVPWAGDVVERAFDCWVHFHCGSEMLLGHHTWDHANLSYGLIMRFGIMHICIAGGGYRGSPLRPFPRLLLCPLSIPKITIVHGIGCSLNLNISYYCFSVSWEYRQRLVDYGQALDPQNLNLPLSGHPLLQKARTFGLGPPPPPLNKYNRFQHTSHRKSCTAHWGWEGVRGKKPGFL